MNGGLVNINKIIIAMALFQLSQKIASEIKIIGFYWSVATDEAIQLQKILYNRVPLLAIFEILFLH